MAVGFSRLISRTQITTDSSTRTRSIDRFIVHHAATTSLATILALFAPGGRTVSANYALGGGVLVGTVDEDRRAWTSGSEAWDGRAVTIEVANSRAGDPWPVGAPDFTLLAWLIADVASRYGFPIDDTHILTHQELYTRYGASYPTACPGDLQRRKGELLTLARQLQTGTPAGTPTPEEDTLTAAEVATITTRITEAAKRTEAIAAGVPGNGAILIRYARSANPDYPDNVWALYRNTAGHQFRVQVTNAADIEALRDAHPFSSQWLGGWELWPDDGVRGPRPGSLIGHARSRETGNVFELYKDDRGNLVRRLIPAADAPAPIPVLPSRELQTYAATNQT